MDISGYRMYTEGDALGEFRAMGALTSLALAARDDSEQDVAALARRVQQLGAPRSLSLRCGTFRLQGTQRQQGTLPACMAPLLRGLTALDLRKCLFDRTCARAFEEQLCHGALLSLGLDGSLRPLRGLDATELVTGLGILDVGRLTGLTSLDLGCNALGAERAGEVAARLAALRELSTLRLASNGRLGARGAAEFARLSRLTSLDLSDCGVGDAMLASWPSSWPLRSLVLDGNGICDKGTGQLAAVGSLRGLTDLSLARNNLSCTGAERIAQSASLASLTRLCLEHISIWDRGAKALADSFTLPALAHLDIQHNDGVSAAGADRLARSTSLISLKRVLWTPR